MPRGASISKQILFANGKVGGKVHRWPVAVFVNFNAVKAFTRDLKAAYEAKNETLVRQMDPHSPAGESEPIAIEVKFSVTEVQYNPALPAFADDELFG